MGVGIFLIVVGVLVGGVMAAAPRGIWWATQSWKFRNPEANEPSDVAYGMTRVGGVLLVIVALVLGGVVIANGLSKSARDKREKEAKEQQQAAEAAFVVPPPEKRGALPVIGYFAKEYPRGLEVKVYYIAPEKAVAPYVRTMSAGSRFSYPCYSSATVIDGADGRRTVDAELVWAPTKLGDVEHADDCRLGNKHVIHTVDVRDVTATTPILTNGPIVNLNGSEILRAAPGNAVPRLTEELDTDGVRPTVSDRGAVPITAYEINLAPGNGKRYLDISYMVPEGGAGAGSLNGWPIGGCEITPIITGQGTDTITVNLRLRWSNSNGHYDDDDDAKCNTGNMHPGAGASRWIDVTGVPTILTDGPVADRRGTIVMPPAPGNRIPEKR